VVRVKVVSPSGFSEDLPTSGASDAAAEDELSSGLVDALTIDIRTLILGLIRLEILLNTDQREAFYWPLSRFASSFGALMLLVG